MPEYTYTARDSAGQSVEGALSASSQREAIVALTGQQLFPIEVTKRVKPQAMAQFYVQLAALLRSGVPLLRSLEVLARQTSNPALSHTVDDLHHRITEGESLAEAMARHPKAFDELAINGRGPRTGRKIHRSTSRDEKPSDGRHGLSDFPSRV